MALLDIPGADLIVAHLFRYHGSLRGRSRAGSFERGC